MIKNREFIGGFLALNLILVLIQNALDKRKRLKKKRT